MLSRRGICPAQSDAERTVKRVESARSCPGGQYEFGPVAERFWLQPNADLGFGDDATLVALNFDLVYRKSMDRPSIWTAYAAGGPAINWYKLLGYNQTEAGVNLVGGLMHHSGLFTEARVGFIESPRLRSGVGYTFGRNNVARRRPPTPRR